MTQSYRYRVAKALYSEFKRNYRGEFSLAKIHVGQDNRLVLDFLPTPHEKKLEGLARDLFYRHKVQIVNGATLAMTHVEKETAETNKKRRSRKRHSLREAYRFCMRHGYGTPDLLLLKGFRDGTGWRVESEKATPAALLGAFPTNRKV